MAIPFPPPDNPGDDEEVLESTTEETLDNTTEEAHPAAQLPPEAQGEVNGGPLGCCLGVTIGLLLSLIVAVLSRLYADPLAQVLHGGLSVTVRIVMVFLAIAGAIIFGFFGWKIGKLVYREYELSPKQQQKLARLQQRQFERQSRRN
jgi:hypothetical protein